MRCLCPKFIRVKDQKKKKICIFGIHIVGTILVFFFLWCFLTSVPPYPPSALLCLAGQEEEGKGVRLFIPLSSTEKVPESYLKVTALGC
jgi:hypothetical protein